MRCQDCGNQAKKDCVYMRCRSCCRNRGFQCQTHVKSTWVPVSTRRPRTLLHHHHHQQQQDHHHFPDSKRHRHHLASSSTHPPPLGFAGGDNFPAEASFPATFRCVRVSSDDNALDQYAYQTSVSIQGHIFKGILYDQGPVPAEASSSSVAAAILQQPTLFTPTTNYPSSFNVGTQFFPYPKP